MITDFFIKLYNINENWLTVDYCLFCTTQNNCFSHLVHGQGKGMVVWITCAFLLFRFLTSHCLSKTGCFIPVDISQTYDDMMDELGIIENELNIVDLKICVDHNSCCLAPRWVSYLWTWHLDRKLFITSQHDLDWQCHFDWWWNIRDQNI